MAPRQRNRPQVAVEVARMRFVEVASTRFVEVASMRFVEVVEYSGSEYSGSWW